MLDDGSIWGMGGDYFGKLGFGDTGEIVTPRKMADSNWPQTFLVTVNASSGGSVDGGGKKLYIRGQAEAIPEKGYIFKSWGKDVNSSLNPLNLKLSKDITLTASFEKDMGMTEMD